jgi:hypothetical protein
MEPLAVDLHLLSQLRGPALRLTPGRALMARVMQADGSGQGLLNIAGAAIEAELPRHVRAGEQLRLIVRQLDSHRVELELPQTPDSNPTPDASQTPPIDLPGGGTLRVLEDPAEDDPAAPHGRDAAGVSTLSLSYSAPALGTLDLRFELAPGGLRVAVIAPAARASELSSAGQALRAALEQAGGRPVSVTVTPRREHLDLYA